MDAEQRHGTVDIQPVPTALQEKTSQEHVVGGNSQDIRPWVRPRDRGSGTARRRLQRQHLVDCHVIRVGSRRHQYDTAGIGRIDSLLDCQVVGWHVYEAVGATIDVNLVRAWRWRSVEVADYLVCVREAWHHVMVDVLLGIGHQHDLIFDGRLAVRIPDLLQYMYGCFDCRCNLPVQNDLCIEHVAEPQIRRGRRGEVACLTGRIREDEPSLFDVCPLATAPGVYIRGRKPVPARVSGSLEKRVVGPVDLMRGSCCAIVIDRAGFRSVPECHIPTGCAYTWRVG